MLHRQEEVLAFGGQSQAGEFALHRSCGKAQRLSCLGSAGGDNPAAVVAKAAAVLVTVLGAGADVGHHPEVSAGIHRQVVGVGKSQPTILWFAAGGHHGPAEVIT